MRRVAPVLVALALAGLTGCGDDEVARSTTVAVSTPTPPPSSGPPLTEDEAFVVGTAKAGILAHCERGRVTEQRFGETVDDLIALAKRKPDGLGSAFGETADTPRNALASIEEDMVETDCSPTILEDVRDAIAALP